MWQGNGPSFRAGPNSLSSDCYTRLVGTSVVPCASYCVVVLQIEQMQQANVELRALLNSYLASPVNKELQVPPMHVA